MSYAPARALSSPRRRALATSRPVGLPRPRVVRARGAAGGGRRHVCARGEAAQVRDREPSPCPRRARRGARHHRHGADVRDLRGLHGRDSRCELRPRTPAYGAVVRGDLHLLDALAAKRGLVFATVHTAGWEAVGPLLGKSMGLRVMIAEHAERDAAAGRIQDDARRAHGVLVAHVGDDPFSALPLVRHLPGRWRRGPPGRPRSSRRTEPTRHDVRRARADPRGAAPPGGAHGRTGSARLCEPARAPALRGRRVRAHPHRPPRFGRGARWRCPGAGRRGTGFSPRTPHAVASLRSSSKHEPEPARHPVTHASRGARRPPGGLREGVGAWAPCHGLPLAHRRQGSPRRHHGVRETLRSPRGARHRGRPARRRRRRAHAGHPAPVAQDRPAALPLRGGRGPAALQGEAVSGRGGGARRGARRDRRASGPLLRAADLARRDPGAGLARAPLEDRRAVPARRDALRVGAERRVGGGDGGGARPHVGLRGRRRPDSRPRAARARRLFAAAGARRDAGVQRRHARARRRAAWGRGEKSSPSSRPTLRWSRRSGCARS